MRKKIVPKQIFVLALSAAVAMSGFTACSSDTSTTTITTQSESQSDTQAETTTAYQIQSIDGDSIIAVKGELTTASMGEKPDENGTRPEGASAPEQPESREDTVKHSGGNGGGGKTSFSAGDETITFTITDDTKITVESFGQTSEGSSTDLTEGAILVLELNSDNRASSITVKNTKGGGKKTNAMQNSDSASDTTAASSEEI